MRRLIAVCPILFESQNYNPGDELPTHDIGFVKAWTKNGAAIWKDDKKSEKHTIKAKPVTASAGLPGNAYPSARPEQDLIGKPPSRRARGAQPEPSKRREKTCQ